MPTLLRKTLLFTLLLLFSKVQSAYSQLNADFTSNNTTGCSPLLINFTSTSTGNPTSYQWDLGNGTQSTVANPSVTYFTPGVYTVTLIITDANGNRDTAIKSNYITVNAKPVVQFSASDTIGCYPLTVQFTDLSTTASGVNNTWLWDFGDGTSSTLQNPVKTYGQGTYTVVLRVTNSVGCSQTFSKPNYIRATNGTIANFNFVNPNSCQVPVAINFNNTSTGTGILSYAWNFGDGSTSTQQNPTHTYSSNGNYTVTLTTSNNQGCSNTYTMTNAISVGNNNAAFTSADSVCVNAPLSFTNTTTPAANNVLWSFGDGTTSTTTNPIKSYGTPGVYTVKLVADFGACKDSASKTITVLQKPTTNFSANNTTSCSAPFTVNFTTATSATTYQWNFGDGSTATQQNPTHTYTATGSYTVTLITTNSLGCSDTLIRTNYIQIQAPTLNFINLPDSGCRPLTIVPQYNFTSLDGIASYQWSFGDGGTSTAANPSHTYNTVGIYTITLTITTNGGCTTGISAIVKVGTKPNVNFGANPTTTCAFSPLQFTDSTTGSATYWYWQFGDGGTSYFQNPNYTYQDTGFFSVTLIVGNNGCYDTLIRNNYIYIKPPIARFNPANDCAAPYAWSFTDNSINALTWSWNFGDGTTSTLQNPTHTYAATGVYTVTLSVTNGTCEHTTNRIINIIDENPDFVADDVEICRNSSIAFTSLIHRRSNISSFTWNFGDGTILSGDSIINHIYTQSGTYTVTLTIVDINGCSKTHTKNMYIKVFGPVANFAALLPGTCLNTPVVFNDQSTTDGIHNITSWQWNFGDGNSQTYTTPPFIHPYTADGVYTVALTITDGYGCRDSITKPNAIIIAKPIANFNSIDTATCPNRNIVFNNTSVGTNLTYVWDFGDNTTSTQTSPIHQYTTDGVYTVKLFVTDQYGCIDSIIKPSYLNVISPVASFLASDTFGTCPPLFVQFTNQAINYTSFVWDFGDGSTSTILDPSHFYTQPGSYVAKLTATSSGGCTHTFTKTIVIQGPTGNFTYTPLVGCKPLQVSFTANAINTSSYVFDFNNGQTASTTNNQITYTYTQQGKFLPRIILKDNNGCSIPVLGLDSITVYGVTSNIAANSTVVCDSGFVQFNANAISNDLINTFTWNFGDGSTATGATPTHHYTTAGNYTVQCITTTQQSCRDTAILNIPINIVQSPIVDFTPSNAACIPATANFTPQIIRNDTSVLQWQWNFGNGQTSTQMQPPSQVYPNAGTYIITSIATNASGCKDTVTRTYTAHPLPVVNAGPDVQICRSSPTNLTASGATSYVWSSASNLSCTNCTTTVANPDSTGLYYLVGTDANGCVNRDTVKVTVIQRFVMQNSPDASFCMGGFTTLAATGANSYVWSPSAGLSSTTAAQVIARPTTTTNYTVIGSDAFNCFKDTSSILVTVYPLPTVNAGPDVTIVGGLTTTLNAATTGNIISYNWSNSQSLSCATCPSPIAKPLITTTYKVDVVSQGGCRSSDEVTVFIICDKGNVFIPNTFSPNGDGMNDIMYPRGNGIHLVKAFRIFNRWGEMVYEQTNFAANDPTKGWNGTYKGVKLSSDVYVYTIEVLCTNKTPMDFKGNITLIQ